MQVCGFHFDPTRPATGRAFFLSYESIIDVAAFLAFLWCTAEMPELPYTY